MKRTPEQSARVAAWLNMLDHCEAQLQSLGALKSHVKAGSGPCVWDRLRALKGDLKEAQEQIATLKARKARGVLRGRKSRETIERLQQEVARRTDRMTQLEECNRVASIEAASLFGAKKISEERRLELLALAQLLGCDCVPHKVLEAVSLVKERAESLASGLLEEKKAKAKLFSDVAALLGCDPTMTSITATARRLRNADPPTRLAPSFRERHTGKPAGSPDGLHHDRAHVDKPEARPARSVKVKS